MRIASRKHETTLTWLSGSCPRAPVPCSGLGVAAPPREFIELLILLPGVVFCVEPEVFSLSRTPFAVGIDEASPPGGWTSRGPCAPPWPEGFFLPNKKAISSPEAITYPEPESDRSPCLYTLGRAEDKKVSIKPRISSSISKVDPTTLIGIDKEFLMRG